ncbi:MAG: DUF192 domain-containing protein [Rhodospirillales bacterium]|nr:DUF192 domain-containing protein [Rhodospirillales bacterium]
MSRLSRRALLAAALAAAPIASRAAEPTGPQPELPRETLTIVTADGKSHLFHVEIARTPEEQITGLMFRKQVAPDGGMLFVWPQPIVSRMWMKNTLVPLDMVFIAADGRIDSIAEDTVPRSLRTRASHGKVIATLELAGGTTQRLGITVGDKVTLPRPH